ncbi:uncharacterized protein LOC124796460 [Schistocerca piceifrons]|uniref:uncharacterized protein LOC124796460 n=1 Tax=Schistocerca piceifrons TaxID=274613 RepID=UPI001F5EE3F8|nr:uncharacterized protein LOC124796460 [Schistocerca piceifrons]
MDSKNAENVQKSSNGEQSDRTSESEESYYNPYRGGVILETFVFLSAENVVWKLVICASCIIIHIVQLYDMFFWNYLKLEISWKAIRWLCDFVYLVDVASAILHRKLKNISMRSDQKPRKIGCFVLDFVSLIPIDFICGISERAYTDDLYKVTFLQRSLRIYRIVIYLHDAVIHHLVKSPDDQNQLQKDLDKDLYGAESDS